MKKYLLTLILLLAVLFSGCNGNDISISTGMIISENTDVTIVRGDSSSDTILKDALKVRDTICEVTGGNIALTTDWIKDKEDYDKNAPEILIGSTNRSESDELEAELVSGNHFRIKTTNNKVLINATSDSLINEAVDYFINNYMDISGSKIKIPDNIDYTSDEYNFFEVVRGSEARCDFVIPAGSDKFFYQTVEYVAERINNKYGCNMKILTGDQISNPKNMIVVGNVGDKVSEEFVSHLTAGDSIISYSDDRLVVAGYNDTLTLSALGTLFGYFEDNIDADINGNLYLYYPESKEITEEWESEAPKYVGATLESNEMIASKNSVMEYSGGDPDSFALYTRILKSAGYTILSKNELGEKFTCIAKNNTTGAEVTVKYTSTDGKVLVYLDTK